MSVPILRQSFDQGVHPVDRALTSVSGLLALVVRGEHGRCRAPMVLGGVAFLMYFGLAVALRMVDNHRQPPGEE
ncbi:hypothetical protein I4F81_011712 [Pyropia yezoensis]|uniref:Uncharacterized protein n=1 Tax=Pyropia yezoensis TaxID=2788 RepID=A0ACC3CH95_PYRYE|nr:hypothetical protein I4F81_011712 [Neopyropia yezoensis]